MLTLDVYIQIFFFFFNFYGMSEYCAFYKGIVKSTKCKLVCYTSTSWLNSSYVA